MLNVQITDHVMGKNDAGRWVEGYVLRKEPVYGPGGTVVRSDAYLLDYDLPNKISILLVSDCRIIAHNVFAHTTLLRDRGFSKTGDAWVHPQHPFPDIKRIAFPQAAIAPVPPDMQGIAEAIKALALTPKAAL